MTSPKAPWWQTTTTSKHGFIMGGGFGVFALGHWIALAIDSGDTWPWVLLRILIGVLATMLAVGHLTSAVLLRRRRRAEGERDS